MAEFSASVSNWVAKSQTRMVAVHRESSERVVRVAQTPRAEGGRMPVDTSFLQNSGIPSLNEPETRVGQQATESQVSLTLAQLGPGDTFYFVWTAAYAARVNWGFVGTDSLGRTYNQQPAGFREGAVAQWQQIVNEVVSELRRRSA